MVTRMPPIRPIQFSALKALNPLHQQPEEAEHENGQADICQVFHWSSKAHGTGRRVLSPAAHISDTGGEAGRGLSMRLPCDPAAAPNRTHAARGRRACAAQAASLDALGQSAAGAPDEQGVYSTGPRTPTS